MVLVVKNPPAYAGDARDTGLIPGLEDRLEEEMATHSCILARKFHGQKNLSGCRARGHKESGMTEHTHTEFVSNPGSLASHHSHF